MIGKMGWTRALGATLFTAIVLTGAASGQTVKIGVVTTFSGPQASIGEYSDRGMRLYMKQHPADLPPGVKIEIINRDDGGSNPDKAKQLAQELIVRDKVNLLMGGSFSPNALAIAPIIQEAKIPFIITNSGTSIITTKSDYIVRFSFTVDQAVAPLGAWAAKNFKTVYTMVSDYASGYDTEKGFIESFKAAGGTVAGSVRVPLQNLDFSPYMQRVKDAKPDALMLFVPAGKTASNAMKSFASLGLRESGVKLIGPGGITPDEEIPGMGDEAIGVNTVYHYSAGATRPENKAFVDAWRKEYGADAVPNFVAVAGYDAMAAVYFVVRAQNGRIDTDKTVALLRAYSNAASPRGPIAIDPDTRDIVQNEYLREIRRVDGALSNVEIETLATALKDPGKATKGK